jgi:hypothetical protein
VYEYVAFGPRSFPSVLVHLLLHAYLRISFFSSFSPLPNRKLIETARQHVAVAADLTMVRLYWNIGRIITQDIQRNERRAAYGVQLLSGLAAALTEEYGEGYSKINLQDMRRFHAYFEIDQTPSASRAG